MHSSIAHITWVFAPTELHALLLEDVLIKRCLPMANKRQKKMGLQVWLALDPESLSLKLLESPDACDESSRVFGPFKDKFYAELLAEIAKTYYGARTTLRYSGRGIRMTRAVTGNAFDVSKYYLTMDQAAADLTRFLQGEDQDLLSYIRATMEELTAHSAFEDAANARDTLKFCERFFAGQQFARSFRTKRLLIRDSLGEIAYEFDRGEVDRTTPCWKEWLDYANLAGNVQSFLYDRAVLVRGWLHSSGKDYSAEFTRVAGRD